MKKFQTKEECLKDLGEHAWRQVFKGDGLSCLVYHLDGYCSNNDKVEECYHCPAKRAYTRKQPEVWGWIELK